METTTSSPENLLPFRRRLHKLYIPLLYKSNYKRFLWSDFKAIFYKAEFSAGSDIFFCLKTTFHSTIFDIPMRPLREDQRHRGRFTR